MPTALRRSVTVTIPKADVVEGDLFARCVAGTVRPIALMQTGSMLTTLRANQFLAGSTLQSRSLALSPGAGSRISSLASTAHALQRVSTAGSSAPECDLTLHRSSTAGCSALAPRRQVGPDDQAHVYCERHCV